MKFAIATFHVPHPQGSAAGRQLWALAEEMLAEGHELTGWCWGPDRHGLVAPQWCEHRPFVSSGPRHRLSNLFSPRADVGRSSWPVPDGAVLWADDWASWPIVDRPGRPALLTVHYDVGLDRRALAQRSLPSLQDLRAQRRAVRRSRCTVALSRRVAAAAGVDVVVPATLPIPATPLPLVDEPVALMLADWTWPANLAALRTTLAMWREVRTRVPAARLLVAGRGSEGIAGDVGVEVMGEVERTADAMGRAAVLAFPCPPTSGPKMKVLDAALAGLPVVTTRSGAEGLDLPEEALGIAGSQDFAETLADVLSDPARRAAMALAARDAATRAHAPAVAVRARLDAVRRSYATDGE